MAAWNSRQFLAAGQRAGIGGDILSHAVATAELTMRHPQPGPPILTLGHLSHLTGIDVRYLRGLVARDRDDPYREFTIRKRPVPGRPPRLRFIAIPEPKLMAVQKWIAVNVLSNARCHSSSVAYAPKSRLVDAAARHRNAQWLVKVDVRDFFESISEIDTYRVFLERGYQPLVALELSRVCTRLRDEHRVRSAWLPRRWRASMRSPNPIGPYYQRHMGFLPQGAPTSPMLANLAVRPLDDVLAMISDHFGVRYTRYADDLVFSTTDKSFGRERCISLVGKVYRALGDVGLSPNTSKTSIVPPGGRKVVLGLLVDGKEPRLTRDFRRKMRMHLHFITESEMGPAHHARKRGFSSVEGLRQHLLGLIAFANQIDPIYADECRKQLRSADWSTTLP